MGNQTRLKIIGRLITNRYMHNNRLVEQRSFTVLKRKSVGDISDLVTDPEYDIPQINFSKYKDGIYELTVINISRDCETGIIDDWELTLESAE